MSKEITDNILAGKVETPMEYKYLVLIQSMLREVFIFLVVIIGVNILIGILILAKLYGLT